MSGSLDFSTVRHSAVLKSDLLDGLFLAVCFLTEGFFFLGFGVFFTNTQPTLVKLCVSKQQHSHVLNDLLNAGYPKRLKVIQNLISILVVLNCRRTEYNIFKNKLIVAWQRLKKGAKKRMH